MCHVSVTLMICCPCSRQSADMSRLTSCKLLGDVPTQGFALRLVQSCCPSCFVCELKELRHAVVVQTVQTNINRLVTDVQGGNTDAIQADASGLQQQFDALRKAIPRLNAKNSDKATIAEKSNGGSN